MPKMPKGVEEGILKGIYKFRETSNKRKTFRAHLFGSGTILNEALKAQEILENDYDIASDVWSVTSYKELYHDAMEAERYNRLNPTKSPKVPYLKKELDGSKGIYVAASDYVKALPASVAKWVDGPLVTLGTDGYGRSEGRSDLRDYFEVDARHIAFAAVVAMAEENKVKASVVKKAMKDLGIKPDKPNPFEI
jgi:pyruvate dehydrogenase E1 component